MPFMIVNKYIKNAISNNLYFGLLLTFKWVDFLKRKVINDAKLIFIIDVSDC